MFVPFFGLRWLANIWQLRQRGATAALGVEFKFPRRRCKLSFHFPLSRPHPRESLLAGYKLSKFFPYIPSCEAHKQFGAEPAQYGLEVNFKPASRQWI